MEDWAACESRGPWVRSSLKYEISRLRESANRARKAYNNGFMGKPFNYIADAYDEAANVWPEVFFQLMMITGWVCGVAVAKGFWMMIGCVLFPPMAWVVLAMRYLA